MPELTTEFPSLKAVLRDRNTFKSVQMFKETAAVSNCIIQGNHEDRRVQTTAGVRIAPRTREKEEIARSLPRDCLGPNISQLIPGRINLNPD